MDQLHTVSDEEITRLQIMTLFDQKQLTQKQAAEQLKLSVRQIKRLWQGHKEHSPAGLIHKNRGKPSHNQLKVTVRQQALDSILEHYRDFGVRKAVGGAWTAPIG